MREQPRERIADHGAAKMSDVHLLRDVRMRVVDDDGVFFRRRLDAEPRVFDRRVARFLEPRRLERHVQESRAGDLDLLDQVIRDRAERLRQLFGDHARCFFRTPREAEREIGLEVRAIRETHLRIDIRVLRAERGFDRLPDER